MRYRTLLTIAIYLTSVYVVVENAEAQVLWRGFSELCYDAQFKHIKNPENTYFEVKVYSPELEVSCTPKQPYEYSRYDKYGKPDHPKCFPAKDTFPVNLYAKARLKEKHGKAVASKCISLAKYDDHDASNHVHACDLPGHGKEEEVLDSAWLQIIETDYKVVECKHGFKKDCKVILRGKQKCTWTGDFNKKACQPEDGAPFYCYFDKTYTSKR